VHNNRPTQTRLSFADIPTLDDVDAVLFFKFYPGTGLSFLGPTRVHSPHRFSQVCRAYGRGQQTDIQTDHTTRVAIVSISCGAA